MALDRAGNGDARVEAAERGGEASVVLPRGADGRPRDLDRAEVELETQIDLEPHRAATRAGAQDVEQRRRAMDLPQAGILDLHVRGAEVEADHVQSRAREVDGQADVAVAHAHRLLVRHLHRQRADRDRLDDHVDGVVERQLDRVPDGQAVAGARKLDRVQRQPSLVLQERAQPERDDEEGVETDAGGVRVGRRLVGDERGRERARGDERARGRAALGGLDRHDAVRALRLQPERDARRGIGARAREAQAGDHRLAREHAEALAVHLRGRLLQRQRHRRLHERRDEVLQPGCGRVAALDQDVEAPAAPARRRLPLRGDREVDSARRRAHLHVGVHRVPAEEGHALREVEARLPDGEPAPGRLVGTGRERAPVHDRLALRRGRLAVVDPDGLRELEAEPAAAEEHRRRIEAEPHDPLRLPVRRAEADGRRAACLALDQERRPRRR